MIEEFIALLAIHRATQLAGSLQQRLLDLAAQLRVPPSVLSVRSCSTRLSPP